MGTSELVDVVAPHDGCFYRASGPEADPFVEIGAVVYPGDVVCIIEAMKFFNNIPYDGPPGIVIEILIANNDSVEKDAVLFRIRPDASLPPRKRPAKTVEGLEAELGEIAESLQAKLAAHNHDDT
jgi:multidrug efflux pump subunit AcrA (membrane-fusion protein)